MFSGSERDVSTGCMFLQKDDKEYQVSLIGRNVNGDKNRWRPFG